MLMRTSHGRVSISAEGRAVFYHEYVEMEITTKPNDSSGICAERDNFLPGLIQISKCIFTWENSQNIPSKEASNGKAALLAGFQTAGKRLIAAQPYSSKRRGGKELFTGNNHNYRELPAESPVTVGPWACVTQASCP